MKCLIKECQNQANGTYPTCSQEHGTSLRMRRQQIEHAMSVRLNSRYNAFGDTDGIRKNYSVEDAIYYSQI